MEKNLGTSPRTKTVCSGSFTRTELPADVLALAAKKIPGLGDYFSVETPYLLPVSGGFIWKIIAYPNELPFTQADIIYINPRQHYVQLNGDISAVPPIKQIDGGVYAKIVAVKGDCAVEYSNLFIRLK